MSFAYDSPNKFVYPVENLSIRPVESEKVKYESTEDLKINKNEDTNNHSPKDDTSCSSTLSYRSEISSSGSSVGYEDYKIHDHSNQANSKWVLSKLFSWNKNKAFQPVSSLSNGNNNTQSKYIEKTAGTTAFLIQQSRPSNLPAKNAVEEEFHRKQYNAILRAARKREIREEKERQLQRELQFKEEERLAEETNVWNLCILPQFEYYRHTKKVHELWWRGLPSSVRGKVWKRAVDNYLNITPHLYNSCLEKSISNPSNDSLIAIRLDVSRTFPHLCVFQEGGPLFDSLQSILAAYSVYRPDVGYVQGMSFIGAVLSLNMESVDAFICFANLLNRPCHKAAFMLNQDKMNMYYKVYSSALAHQLPKIFSHFSTTGLSPDFYLLDWLYTIYAKAMPLDVACRVWDIFIRDGEEFLFRTALGVLNLYQKELLEMDFIHGAQFLTRLPENLQGDALFNSINQMSTTIGSVTFQQMLVEIEAI